MAEVVGETSQERLDYPYQPLPSVFDDDDDSPDSEAEPMIIFTKHGFTWRALILAVIFYIASIIMPLFNCVLFDGYEKVPGYPYPLTATWLQMLGVTVILFLYNVANHLIIQRKDVLKKSWIFGPGFLWKCWELLFVSIAFALVMSLSNIGLFLLNDVNVHVLLRSTEIIWVVLSAIVLSRERPSIITIVACMMLIAGSIIISLDFKQGTHSLPWMPVLINLLSAVAGGLMLALLRRACLRLHERDPTISILEITLIKMGIATLLLTPPMLGLELHAWPALATANLSVQLLVAGGVFLTMVFQSSVVGLAAFSLATTVGTISQSKIVPQVILGSLLHKYFKCAKNSLDVSIHLLGTILIVLAVLAYAIDRWRINAKEGIQEKLRVMSVRE